MNRTEYVTLIQVEMFEPQTGGCFLASSPVTLIQGSSEDTFTIRLGASASRWSIRKTFAALFTLSQGCQAQFGAVFTSALVSTEEGVEMKFRSTWKFDDMLSHLAAIVQKAGSELR